MTRYVEVQTKHDGKKHLLDISEDIIDMFVAIGETVTPLVAMTKERVAAIEIIDEFVESNCDEHAVVDAINILRAMLAEVEGGVDGR